MVVLLLRNMDFVVLRNFNEHVGACGLIVFGIQEMRPCMGFLLHDSCTNCYQDNRS